MDCYSIHLPKSTENFHIPVTFHISLNPGTHVSFAVGFVTIPTLRTISWWL
ncbi:hypothetical protein Tsubulata_009832 [Turnera subulata]|uniref:Uncharacterized protein n=1 Tax=Turnera subulata TaxID=218843 RepID=A0A9Q0G9E1_9ROSI|nr:hypothetical protein Tsubulata_009832 [Turnera subulata]